MTEAKRRKESNRAALKKCWKEDIDWDLFPPILKEVGYTNAFQM